MNKGTEGIVDQQKEGTCGGFATKVCGLKRRGSKKRNKKGRIVAGGGVTVPTGKREEGKKKYNVRARGQVRPNEGELSGISRGVLEKRKTKNFPRGTISLSVVKVFIVGGGLGKSRNENQTANGT